MSWRSLIFASFCTIALLVAGAGSLMGQQPATPVTRPDFDASQSILPAFKMVGLEDRPKLEASVRLTALRARHRLLDTADQDWQGTAIIFWTDEAQFLEKTGHRPEHSAAAASASRKIIWINEAAWSRASEEERTETMTHELAHLLVGNLPGGRELPLWAQEGLAMHLAEQWTLEERMLLHRAHLFGRLPLLENLEREFPAGGDGQTLAYQMSYTTISEVARIYGDEPGEVRRLLRRLSDPKKGPRLGEDFWDAFIREGWQRAVDQSLGSRLTTGVILLSTGGLIFLIMAVLVILAFFKLSFRRKKWADEVEEEEAWAESLTDEDIQDVWGDREDRWEEN